MTNSIRRVRGTRDEYVAVTSLPDQRTLRLDAPPGVTLNMDAAHRLAVTILNACDEVAAHETR